jgi:acyl-CoA synthetase (AMP-forming)/AMP-acid ligase II
MSSLDELTLGAVLAQHRRSRPMETAAVCGDVRLTWPELDERVNRLAGGLRAAGVGAGDRVLWLGQNCHRVLEGVLAAGRLGAVFCPANWRQSPEELAFVVQDADPAVVIWQEEETGPAVRKARELVADDRAVWLQHDAAGRDTYEDLLSSAPPLGPDEVAVDPASAVLMIYTAAFGGQPNGALLSHRAVLSQNLVIARAQETSPDDIFLNSGPLFHVGTLMSTMATFHMGGCNVFIRRVDAEELCRIIDRERCTGAFILPPTRDEMVAVNADRRYDLSSLRAAPGSRAWNEMVTIDTSPWWRHPGGTGQTEVMGMATFNWLGAGTAGAHGRPSPMVELRIVDEDDRELPVGEVGEIVLRGPVVMNGYHNRPELNAKRQRNGWHHSNDLGRIEADGSVTFIGPKARMIKSAAENIYPAEVEQVIARHPAVREVAVIGVPDRVWTQSVKAIVVLADGAEATEADIIEHCRASIASYKKPRSVEFIDALPRVGMAVDYETLDAQFDGGGYPGGWNRSA